MNEFQYKSLLRRERASASYKSLQTRSSRWLVFGVLISIFVVICLIMALWQWQDITPEKTQLIIEGFIGLLAILSVIFTAILMYRINAASWEKPTD